LHKTNSGSGFKYYIVVLAKHTVPLKNSRSKNPDLSRGSGFKYYIVVLAKHTVPLKNSRSKNPDLGRGIFW
jgi:hypothetical protein